ncbi:MAG: hypothetical protein A3D31_07355 [Candidatus Fluviicola riflensis]|nr:MAG: hypothetical protein CHH17_07655 [Candidatus Fluviicola riflensis]OGS79764.1 MAG: hypothetical protein A3D31_07355 [Candidatus Fluviicola riflensis]OGS87197.1 MAG: hypothetical protein A2724_06815 [Fluviicola sp. RIFCSPHIGHO2_01_FULL_43_53]OGS89985.1 MAG: hypothetical protein A3E30_03560 [Fluviicola sp. RIFCSPHIGHO2_12_FULL_43_24]
MVRKLLFRHQEKTQLVIAIIGAFLGMTFLLTSIHYLIKVNEFGEGAEILGPNTIIVQKKVSTSNTLNIAKTDFTMRELENMRKEPFIIDVQPVETNNFDVSFETADKLVPRFRSDVFIQTVDPDFLDVKSDKWKWKEGDSIVPIIMPRDFLVMLNTFMSASGIPQVSDELAMDIKFKFTLSNETEKEWANVRIIGFTNEVSSILVPQSFMSWANEKYGIDDNQRITQVMISGKESEFGLVEEMLKKKHLESRNGQMVIGRLKSMVGTLILIVLGISVIAVFVSGLVLIQYLQLLLSKNTYEVRTLLRLGYSPKLLTRHFFLYFTKVFGIVATLSLISFVLFKFWLDTLFEEGGLYIGTTFTATSIGSLVAAYGIFALVSYLNAKKGIYRSNNG